VSWSIKQTQQYNAGCKDIYAIYVSSRVTEDPVLHDGCHVWSRNCLPSGVPKFTHGFLWGSFCSIFV